MSVPHTLWSLTIRCESTGEMQFSIDSNYWLSIENLELFATQVREVIDAVAGVAE